MTPGETEATSPHYHPIGMAFHWLMAAMVFVQLWWGWRTSALMAGYEKAEAYIVHAQLGAAIMLVAFLRLGWRIIAPFVAPRLEKPEDLPGWQHFAAEATHWGLYVLMFVLPLTGLLMIGSTAPETMERALGLTGFRDMSLIERARLEHLMERTHFVLVWGMVGLITAHVGAALKHHFIDRDDVLARMIPWLGADRPDPEGSAARKARIAKATR